MNFPSINIQGNIISSEIIEKVRIEDIKYQQSGDFKLDKKSSVRDEIGFAWAAIRAHWTAFRIRAERLAEGESGVTSTRNSWMVPFFQELGYTLQFKPGAEEINFKSYPISHRGSNINDFPVHIMGINDDLDKRRESGGPRLSPHALMQEYLNNSEHVYALVSNGRYLRLLRDATRLVRLSYLEFDLERMMEEELYADFAILFRLLHATRMPQHPDNLEESPIEYYHQESLASGSRIREKLSEAVESSIKLLANGFLIHPANTSLREQIHQTKLSPEAYYLLQLRLIYRFLFLIVTEERNLVFLETKETEVQRKRKLYYEFYSVERLRKLATRLHFVDGRKHDLWEGLKTTFQIFERSSVGEKLGIKPLGSGLFSPAALGILPDLKLSNEALLKVIRHLTLFENDQKNLVRVNYSDLDVEEFGSVYEGLLEYDAVFSDDNGQPVFSFVQGTGRSSSGSHYTPEELVKPLIKHSLEYIIEDKLKEKDKENALLSIKVCDVACGSGHILLSAARRIAIDLARVRTNEDQPTPTALRHAIRDVIKHCIYGVDKNPLAVELCKVALWLEAHNPGEPLGFLDHHIKCGDAIVGLAHREELEKGIPDEAFKILPVDEKLIASSFSKANKTERKERDTRGTQLKAEFELSLQGNVHEAMAEYGSFVKLPERTPEEIEAKQSAYGKFLNGKGYTFLKTMADTQVAQFFVSKTSANKDRLVTDAEFRQILRGYKSWQSPKTAFAEVVAQEKKFFHWFIEFPEVLEEGGFACIIGNPPFLGGQKLTGAFGDAYLEYLKFQFEPIGAVDLVTYFFRRNFNLIRQDGFLSLISTKTISQGGSRKGGLEVILNHGGRITYAIKNMRWPGLATVDVALLTISKVKSHRHSILNGVIVDNINEFLDANVSDTDRHRIAANAKRSFKGSEVTGEGFILSESEASELIKKYPTVSDVVKPYLIGDDLNSDPQQHPSRWAINFGNFPLMRYDDSVWNNLTKSEQDLALKEKVYAPPGYSRPVAKDFPNALNIIEARVKEERLKKNDARARKFWWQFTRIREDLYDAIKTNEKILAISRYSKYLQFSFVRSGLIYADTAVVIAFDTFCAFSILNSVLHECWAWKYGSTMGAGTLRYTNVEIFETFPFPDRISPMHAEKLEVIGREYLHHRKELMLLMHLGLTKIYNLYHSEALSIDRIKEASKLPEEVVKTSLPMILELRTRQMQLDKAVLSAFGWTDIELNHNFYDVEYLPEDDRKRYTIDINARKEILKRLLELNHKLYADEVEAGLLKKNNSVKEKKSKNEVEEPKGQYGLKL
jgi:hypothetical protein